MAARFIELTAPNGDKIFVNPEHIVAVRPARSDHPNAATVIVTLAGECAVQEGVPYIVSGRL